jgi:hypothetical protein
MRSDSRRVRRRAGTGRGTPSGHCSTGLVTLSLLGIFAPLRTGVVPATHKIDAGPAEKVATGGQDGDPAGACVRTDERNRSPFSGRQREGGRKRHETLAGPALGGAPTRPISRSRLTSGCGWGPRPASAAGRGPDRSSAFAPVVIPLTVTSDRNRCSRSAPCRRDRRALPWRMHCASNIYADKHN